MSHHSFDPEIASRVGVNAAVIYQNILFWTRKNLANERHVHDGKVWTYNSLNAFCDLFPYLTSDQIRRALVKLVDAGLICKGNFNQSAYDRTLWYGVFCQVHLAKTSNGMGQNPKPIPDSKPDTKPDTKKDASDEADFFSGIEQPKQEDQTEVFFDRFWKVYPKKSGKPSAFKAFKAAVKKVPPEKLIEAARRYADWLASGRAGEFRPPAKMAQGWLNDERWNDPDIAARAPTDKAAELRARYSSDEI